MKIGIYKTIVESVAMYGTKIWEMTKQNHQRLRALEIGFWLHSHGLHSHTNLYDHKT